MIIDCHAHFDDKKFDKDRDELVTKMQEMGIGLVVNSASDYKSMQDVVDLSKQYDMFYYSMGLHPTEIKGADEKIIDEIAEYAKGSKCLAVGEIGLDYNWEKDPAEQALQKKWFLMQLELAKKLDMPVVIHSRDACEDTFNILKEIHKQGIICDIHCFSYSTEIALEYVKMGFYIGIGGVVTFSNAKKLKETVERIPLSSILLETDCPYLAPDPFRGQRNDSTNLPYVVRAIAKIKGTTEDDVIEVTEQNARKFYRI